MSATCSIEGCNRPHVARGWCWRHYQQWRRHSDPLYVAPRRTHCKHGHAFDDANTGVVETGGRLKRYCRECARARQRRCGAPQEQPGDEPQATRMCRRCGETKPLDGFAAHPTTSGKRIHVCHVCRGKHMSAVHRGQVERIFDGWSRVPKPVESSAAYKARIKARLLAARGGQS